MPLFHSPHPGFMGAAARCPDAVCQAAKALEDRNVPLDDALYALKKAAVKGEIKADRGCVFLTLDDDQGRTHCWRVICFDPDPP